jgi:hypothetical protein
MNAIVAGIAVGILIGTLTGTVLLLLLKTANKASIRNASSLITLTGQILAIPAIWFGGWLTNGLFESTADFMNYYVAAVATIFVVMVIYPIFRWIGQLARELGRDLR